MWREKYEILRTLPPSGQAAPFVVRSKDDAAGPELFLKELRDHHISERRERMSIEVACYRVLEHPGIPKLIDTNVEYFKKRDVPLYLVTEFIAGRTVDSTVQNRPKPASEALAFITAFLDILAYAHQKDAVHRDIKPENVMLRDNNPSFPVLVDWGISFLESEEDRRITDLGSEIGNRFLRLPDHAVRSSNKRDPRSDLTQAAGLLFYYVTGERPINLRDSEGLPPHQRSTSVRKLAALTDIGVLELQSFFDRAFDLSINVRFQSAEEMLTALKLVARAPATPSTTTDEAIAEILHRMNDHSERRAREAMAALELVERLLYKAQKNLVDKFGGAFTTFQSGHGRFPKERMLRNAIGLVKEIDHEIGFKPVFELKVEGDDVVVAVVSTDAAPQIVGRVSSAERLGDHSHAISTFEDFLVRGLQTHFTSRS